MYKRKINLGFCEVYYNKSDKSIDESIKFIKRAFKYNKEFFKLSNIQKFKIILVYSRKELDRLYRKKTSNYVPAFAKKTKIIIFSLNVFERETCWKKRDFYSTLVHEINHIFFTGLTKEFYEPIWLSEGLATYIQHNKRKPKKKTKIFYSILNKKFDYKTPRYNMYHLLVYYLIKKYGKEKFIRFLRLYNKNKDIERSSQIIYSKKVEGLIRDANKI